MAAAALRASRFHDGGDVFVVKEPEGTIVELDLADPPSPPHPRPPSSPEAPPDEAPAATPSAALPPRAADRERVEERAEARLEALAAQLGPAQRAIARARAAQERFERALAEAGRALRADGRRADEAILFAPSAPRGLARPVRARRRLLRAERRPDRRAPRGGAPLPASLAFRARPKARSWARARKGPSPEPWKAPAHAPSASGALPPARRARPLLHALRGMRPRLDFTRPRLDPAPRAHAGGATVPAWEGPPGPPAVSRGAAAVLGRRRNREPRRLPRGTSRRPRRDPPRHRARAAFFRRSMRRRAPSRGADAHLPGARRRVGEPLRDARRRAGDGAEPLAGIVVPCHRVVGSGGKPGGFSAAGGLVTKARLLALEGGELIAGGAKRRSSPPLDLPPPKFSWRPLV